MKNVIRKILPFVFIGIIIGYIIIQVRPVYPPVRVGKYTSRGGSKEKIYTLEMMLEEAEVIAHIKIGDWLGEDTGYSYYEAFLVEKYKGEIVEKFILAQYGTARKTQNLYPLFISGNELFVFLKSSAGLSEYDNLYYIVNEPGSVFYVVKDDSGDMYYYDRYRALREATASEVINYIPIDSFMRELYDNLIQEKAVLEDELSSGVHYFYKKEDVIEVINSNEF